MSVAVWLRATVIGIGIAALIALIWFAGPLFAFGDVRPLDGVWVRVGLILLVLLVAAAVLGIRYYRRRKAAEELARGIAAEGEGDRDAAVLTETMQDALATLRQAKGSGRDYLYALPWYILIGPPGSGKTTALVNSGLRFPLARGGTPAAVAGVGGTRYCDWWFTEDAVLIDTAGRYTTQDSDPKGDRSAWLTFLDLLKRNRPKQPINGVLVAISLEDLLTSSQEEITAHATQIRKRLTELHDQLKIDFPVYALFTKADLVAGFREFFGHLDEAERRVVWGATFQTEDRTRNMIGEVPAEFDLLTERLNDQLPDRLQAEANPTARVVLFGFPSQMAALKRPVTEFLNRVFEPTRYHANATLRGFYFTSGTQQGTPIDQLIGALAKSFGAEDVGAAAFSGRGRSYFLTDLLTKVVFGEAGWVSTNRIAVRRARILKAAGFAGIAALSLAAAALWWTSYVRNSALIAETQKAVAEYRTAAAPVLAETLISDKDFAKILPLLDKLRYMPAGYAERDRPTPIAATFGLSQRERLESSAETAYQTGLERLLRPRLILRMEEQIEAKRNDPSFLYEALKVYLMLGGQAKLDRELVLGWMRRDWADNLYPGAALARGREALEQHLAAMLDMGGQPLISLNGPLVEEVQKTLARLSVAERAYELLKSQARAESHKDWVVGYRGGPDVGLVFEAVNGEDLDNVRVPYFYTYDGFHHALMGRLDDIAEQLERERWVLGSAGQQSAVQAQYDTLYRDILDLYTKDFVAAWQQALGKLRLRPLTADKPKYIVLAAASAPTSPIKQLLESIRDETRLTRERPGAAPGQNAGAAQGANKGAAVQAVQDALTSKASSEASSRLGRAGLNVRLPSRLPPRGGAPAGASLGGPVGEAPGANIEALFKHFHVVVDGDVGRRPIDALIQNLSDINQTLGIAATNPSQVAQANAALIPQVASLRANASRLPEPFADMMRRAANDFEGDVTGASVAELAQALGDQVTRVCQQIVMNRYPFTRASEREVPMGDFGRLFGPNGILDKFFSQRLASLVDQSKSPWSWRPDSRLAHGLSAATLREFQRAAEIRDAFFPTGGNVPSIAITVTPLTLSGDASNAKLEINGNVIQSRQGVNAPINLQWPGSGVGRTAITLDFGFLSQPVMLERTGTWSLYRMLDGASVLKQGDRMVASFVVGGREVSYQFTTGSTLNPLALPALREFHCPSGI